MENINLFGLDVFISKSIINMWIIMLFLIIFAAVVSYFIHSGKFKLIPESKFQIAVEYFVNMIYSVCEDTMGKKNMGLAPYIGTLAIFLLTMNMSGLIGFRKIPTTDYSVTLGLALATFVIVQTYQLKVHGIGGYIKELFHPFPLMFPLNLLEKVTPVLSMSLRLFGNITAGLIIMELVYEALGHFFRYSMAFIPVPLHFYFDIFDAVIQTMVFVILTMEFVARATALEHD